MKHFYLSALDMKAIQSDYYDSGSFYDYLMECPNVKVKIAKLITDRGVETHIGDMVELVEVMENTSIDQQNKNKSCFGSTHVAFGVPNIHRSIEAISQSGGEVIIPPFQRENGNWIAFARDVEGNWLELIQNV